MNHSYRSGRIVYRSTIRFGMLVSKRGFDMRMIGWFTMCVLLEACAVTPMFPPEIMTNLDMHSFTIQAWQEQTYRPSNAGFVPQKVELGGEIIDLILKTEGVVLLVEEQPIEKHPTYHSKSDARGDAFWYAVAFNGSPEPSMLQRGNKLVVVGMTDTGSTEMFGGAPSVVPHLQAQCLHIWNTRELKPAEFSYYGGPMGYHPPEERTFCLANDSRKSLPINEKHGGTCTRSAGL